MANPAFKPYGKAPPFDLDEYNDSFELWHKKWTIFLSLSTTDCCANCEPTRILGQLIFGVESDDVRVKLLEQGATLTLDMALTYGLQKPPTSSRRI